MTRQTKTPAQRAQEALDVATRRVERCNETFDRLKDEFNDAAIDLRAAERRRDYLAQNPDLVAAAVEPDGDVSS